MLITIYFGVIKSLLSSSEMTFMTILMALIYHLQKSSLLTALLLQIQNMLVGLRLISLLVVVLRIRFHQPLAQRSAVKILPKIFGTHWKCSFISKLSLVDISHDTLLDTCKNDLSIEVYLTKIKVITYRADINLLSLTNRFRIVN